MKNILSTVTSMVKFLGCDDILSSQCKGMFIFRRHMLKYSEVVCNELEMIQLLKGGRKGGIQANRTEMITTG